MVCQKQLQATKLQVEDILSQLDEYHNGFASFIPSKSVHDAMHPEKELSRARRAHDHAVDRFRESEAEQISYAKVEDLFRVIWEREHERHPYSDMDVEYRRQWKKARDASQSARSTFWQRSSEIGATDQWYHEARTRMKHWAEQRQHHHEQQGPKTGPGFEGARHGTCADHKQHRQHKSKAKYGHTEQKPRGNAGQRQHRHHAGPGFQKDQSGTHDKVPPAAQPYSEPTESIAHPISVGQWRESVAAAFADYAVMESFPTPPPTTCKELKCKSRKGRALEVCDCSIREAFQDLENLKIERLKWHPDRFGVCPPGNREVFIKKAQEVFVIVSEMYEYQKNK